jgi:hypothetical protein
MWPVTTALNIIWTEGDPWRSRKVVSLLPWGHGSKSWKQPLVRHKVVALLPWGHGSKFWKQPLVEMQGKATYIRPKVARPIPGPYISRSYMHRAAPSLYTSHHCGSIILSPYMKVHKVYCVKRMRINCWGQECTTSTDLRNDKGARRPWILVARRVHLTHFSAKQGIGTQLRTYNSGDLVSIYIKI